MFENVHRKVKLIKYPLPQADPSSDPLIAITNIEVRILRDLHNWPDDHPPLPRWTSRLRRWRRSPASWSTWPTPPSWSCAGSFSSRTGSTLSSSSSASGASPTLAPGSTWWPWLSCPGWASSPCPSCTRTTRRQWTRLWAPWTPRWMKSRTRSCRSFPWTRIQQRKKSRLPVPVSHVHLKIKSTKSIFNVQTATCEHLNYFICALLLLYVGEAFILPIKKACGLRELFPTHANVNSARPIPGFILQEHNCTMFICPFYLDQHLSWCCQSTFQIYILSFIFKLEAKRNQNLT